jgi:hypothetical protein
MQKNGLLQSRNSQQEYNPELGRSLKGYITLSAPFHLRKEKQSMVGSWDKKANAASSHPDLNEGPVDLQSTALTPELRERVDI